MSPESSAQQEMPQGFSSMEEFRKRYFPKRYQETIFQNQDEDPEKAGTAMAQRSLDAMRGSLAAKLHR